MMLRFIVGLQCTEFGSEWDAESEYDGIFEDDEDMPLDPMEDGSNGSNMMRLKRGITMDSGAHHNVMPRRLTRGKKIRPSAGSKAGMHYIAANKGRIKNEGEVDFDFRTTEGYEESLCFQVAEVSKALGAVSDRVDHSCRVVFDKDLATGKDLSYILHKPSRRMMKMNRIGNVWVLDAIVDMGKSTGKDFARQG